MIVLPCLTTAIWLAVQPKVSNFILVTGKEWGVFIVRCNVVSHTIKYEIIARPLAVSNPSHIIIFKIRICYINVVIEADNFDFIAMLILLNADQILYQAKVILLVITIIIKPD